ncbi:peptide-methionine (S)-S-oxide reductase MsrA [Marinobacterium sp. YM272]|uniref:peptide-methionine (S)-S-oxide reductase MsrA n=1 Tax=Marinobacterium sp. YM272 TaxID=3421654 RepID=UPI003D7F6B24
MKYSIQLFLLASALALTLSQARAEKTVLAGGCFWCMEADFEKLDGVTDVVSGFTGGELEDPTYRGNHQGHLEAVEISYDPKQVSYAQLLEHFWVNIDPFDEGGQFCDRGPSYRSAIFVATDQEREIAEQSRAEVEALFPGREIVTPIRAASRFWPIKGDESYHQDYYKKSPLRYKFYRWNCDRDARLEEIWGDKELN